MKGLLENYVLFSGLAETLCIEPEENYFDGKHAY
jgi:hypothetical protein